MHSQLHFLPHSPVKGLLAVSLAICIRDNVPNSMPPQLSPLL